MDGAGQARRLIDMVVVDATGDWVGTVSEVYLDGHTGEPAWVTVRAGWFGHGSFVPLVGVDIAGFRVRVHYDKATIAASPRHDSCAPLSPAEQDALYAHYGLSSTDLTPPGLQRYVGTGRQSGAASSPGERAGVDRKRFGVDHDDDDTIIRSVN